MKKFLAILLVVVLALSLGLTAFAANDTTTITLPKKADHTYEIYQIFTGNLDAEDGTLNSIRWGLNGTGYDSSKTEQAFVDGDIINELADAVTLGTDTAKLAVIEKYVNLNGTPFDTVDSTEEGKAVEVPYGYYLIKDKAGTQTADESYTLYIVEIAGPVTLTAKDGVPEVVKEIELPDGEKTNVSENSVGDVIDYVITGTMPTNIADYEGYYYEFADTLTKGLTYKADSMKVTLDGKDVTDQVAITIGTYSATDGTAIKVVITDAKALKDADDALIPVTKDSKFIVTYSAILNENAVIDGPNENTVKVVFSNDPNHSGKGTTTENPKGETPDSTVATYTTELGIKKVDENGKVLTGAKFKIEGEGVVTTKVTGAKFEKAPYTAADGETVLTGTYYLLNDGSYTSTAPADNTASQYASTTETYVAVKFVKWIESTETIAKEAFVDENGEVKFTGLGEGTYTLTETVTPKGYNTIDPIDVTVTFVKTDDQGKALDNPYFTVEDGEQIMTVTVVNQSGTVLPSTGGIGTTLFYIVGGLAVAAAVILLISKKRVNAK